jgi:hypothetical protein
LFQSEGNAVKKILCLALAACPSILFLIPSAAQNAAPPVLQPAQAAAPGNDEVLKLLRADMSESVILDKIHVLGARFDTSADALVALKQAGATEPELKAILAQGIAPAAQPPAAKPADQPAAAASATDPSLAETAKFIQDKLNAIGSNTYVLLWNNVADSKSGADNWRSKVTGVVADPNHCSLAYHWVLQWKNVKPIEEDVVIPFSEIHGITVEPLFKDVTEINARSGHPEGIATATNPPLSALLLVSSHVEPPTVHKGGEGRKGHEQVNMFHNSEPFLFSDPNLAVRVGKAIAHASQLCGGAKTESPTAPPEPF